jgi:hypothetical protein
MALECNCRVLPRSWLLTGNRTGITVLSVRQRCSVLALCARLQSGRKGRSQIDRSCFSVFVSPGRESWVSNQTRSSPVGTTEITQDGSPGAHRSDSPDGSAAPQTEKSSALPTIAEGRRKGQGFTPAQPFVTPSPEKINHREVNGKVRRRPCSDGFLAQSYRRDLIRGRDKVGIISVLIMFPFCAIHCITLLGA